MPEDYYSLLGVDEDATAEDILRAYRQKATEHHPDVSDEPDADETFRQLNRAKEVLTDTQRRREYDRLGHDRYVDREDSGSNRPPQGERSRPTDTQDGWDDAGPGVGSLLEGLFGPAFGGRPAGMTGDPHVAPGGEWPPSGRFAVDLESLIAAAGQRGMAPPGHRGPARKSGSDEEGRHECPTCRGRGTFVHDLDTARGRTRRLEPCDRCGGAGTVAE